ncbi:probable LRR receptor-like serine/threonine-protein kinase At1g05700 [Prunus persica]|uniref:probable LRR receptor-like serine/threonine-protein kinase At1g05700 n=1 Tax=Prunus persica TaxID=3760 RepID=UPI0009AB4088|nr:probable LRR receptor-like serine/threonine-protein kinase At1g05700 [Prunus persica]
MWRTLKHFLLFAVLQFGGFALNLMLLVHAQDQSGFISIDCGLEQSPGYTERTTGIYYISDSSLTDTGDSKSISLDYRDQYTRPFWFLRSFPQGTRNCYSIRLTGGDKYLIRASFVYGNYDSQKGNLPEFELHLGATLWDSVAFSNASSITIKELLHTPAQNHIHICLVNIGTGVPFISAIELRPLPTASYLTQMPKQSLALLLRYDVGQTANTAGYRYPNDIYDRLWYSYPRDDWAQLSTLSIINNDQNTYQLPSDVMRTAATPKDISSQFLNISWVPADRYAEYYTYIHFAEVAKLQASQIREISITINGELTSDPFVPRYLYTNTINSTLAFRGGAQSYNFSIFTSEDSFLLPILNAFEVYMVKEFLESETNQKDFDAIANIKSTYIIIKNWQGDPCAPKDYLWEGVTCSAHENESRNIKSLDLSSSGLTGLIAPSISNLTMIQTLDLSNNNLTGPIPDFLSQLPNLNVLNLENNKLTGSVPVRLSDRSKNGLLLLSLCGNPNLSGQVSCNKKKKKHNLGVLVGVPVGISIGILLVVAAAAIWWHSFKTKGEKANTRPEAQEVGHTDTKPTLLKAPSDPRRGQHFTKVEITNITSNYTSLLGEGAFGKVYRGRLENKVEVAVKVLSPRSSQGLEEFNNEVALLMSVADHKNVVSLIGYCDDVDCMALVYAFVAYGNLKQHLSAVLSPSPPASSPQSPDHRYTSSAPLLVRSQRSDSELSPSPSASLAQPPHTGATLFHTAHSQGPESDSIIRVLTWKERLGIALDAARGLNYLHSHRNMPIVHRDVKPANILLDKRLQAKIGDFGISRAFATESITHVSTLSKGTLGYLDPEYHNTKRLNKKSDVYSFGIVLLELITGRRAINTEVVQPGGPEVCIHIIEWVRNEVNNQRIESVVDPKLQGKYKMDSVRKAIQTAMACVPLTGAERPDIDVVYKDLEQCLKMESAPDPEPRTTVSDDITFPTSRCMIS